MRMWMIDPRLLCSQHLRGEHGEIHKHRHCFVDKHSIDGRISPIVQVEPEMMGERHDALAAEMVRRGMYHKSPYQQPDLSYLSESQRLAKANISFNIQDLSDRCPECRRKLLNFGDPHE